MRMLSQLADADNFHYFVVPGGPGLPVKVAGFVWPDQPDHLRTTDLVLTEEWLKYTFRAEESGYVETRPMWRVYEPQNVRDPHRFGAHWCDSRRFVKGDKVVFMRIDAIERLLRSKEPAT